tara:strand:+ start:57 stop:431 length:375 start_codon:yes stop_codon:yes gene_type:complete
MTTYLKQLGLTEYQARVMIVLFCKGEATAKDICTYGGIRQTKIYQVMKSLEDKRLVSYKYTSPREYCGVTPTKAMNSLIGKREKALKQLKDQKQESVNLLKKLELEPIEKNSLHPMWNAESYKL